MIFLRYMPGLTRPNTFELRGNLIYARVQATDVTACYDVVIEPRGRLFQKDESNWLLSYGFIHEELPESFVHLQQAPYSLLGRFLTCRYSELTSV